MAERSWPLLTGQSLATLPRNSTGGDRGDDAGDKLQEWSSLIGIITAIVGNVLIALAINVQRYAHTRLHKEKHRVRQRAREALKRAQSDRLNGGSYGTIGSGHTNGYSNSIANGDHDHDEDSQESDPLQDSFHPSDTENSEHLDGKGEVTSTYLKSPYWWLGQVLITLGEMGNFLAYGFAPASIVSPLGVVALISNCIIAPVIFKERFRQRDFWGVVIAVGGVVTVVLSAKQEETKLNPHDILDAITSLAFEIYLGVTICLIIILMWASKRYGRHTILIDLGLVGLFGGYTALATKGVSSMLSSSLWRAFTTPVTYVLLFILLGTAIMQIRYVNRALQRFGSTQVIPIQFVMFTLCVILGSAILYRDFERTTAEQAGKFVGGCLLTFFGVFLITSGRQQNDDDEDDLLSDVEGVEETIGLANQDTNGGQVAQDNPTSYPQSRRSSKLSRVSFAETIKSLAPQDEPDAPLFQILSSDGLQAHDGASVPLLSNPWQEEEASGALMAGPATPPPTGRGVRTYSTESVLTGCAVESAPAQSHATTPMRDPQIQPLYPTDNPVVSRPGLSPSRPGTHHRSGTFISPSPLSSTVTTVVKDGFLRASDGSHVTNRSSMRRIRSSIRASLFLDGDDANGAPRRLAAPASEDLLGRAFTEGTMSTSTTIRPADGDPEPDEDQVHRRSRSVSDSLGDFFGAWRKQRRKDDKLATDEEEGGFGDEHQHYSYRRGDDHDI